MKSKGTWEEHHGNNIHRKETTRIERVRIIAPRDITGMTWKEISYEIGVDFRTCQKIYARAKITGTSSNRKRSGRPVIFTEDEKARLCAFVTRDRRTRRLMWEEIIEEMDYNCSVQTIRDTMASMGFHKRVPRKT